MLLLLSFCAVVAAVGSSTALAQEDISREYTIKAAYLYNFGRYVTWPEGAFSEADTPFVIGVLGTDPFGEVLDTIAAEKKIEGRRIEVRRFASLDQYTPCHILFVNHSVDPEEQLDVIRRLGDSPVLLVGETPAFAERGGVMNFFVEENKVRFEINPLAAERAQLKISAKLRPLGVERSAAKTVREANTKANVVPEPGLAQEP